MNYTYLPSTPFSPDNEPTIIMTTPPSSKKTSNLLSNPLVSLLVHDWVSHRPPTLDSAQSQGRSGSPPPAARSSLASLLLGMNTAALSRISVTLNGTATILEQGSEEEKWCKARHLENNTFDSSNATAGQLNQRGGFGEGIFGGAPADGNESGDGGRAGYIEGEEVRVVVVRIGDGRIADWRGEVRDFVVGTEQTGEILVNGV